MPAPPWLSKIDKDNHQLGLNVRAQLINKETILDALSATDKNLLMDIYYKAFLHATTERNVCQTRINRCLQDKTSADQKECLQTLNATLSRIDRWKDAIQQEKLATLGVSHFDFFNVEPFIPPSPSDNSEDSSMQIDNSNPKRPLDSDNAEDFKIAKSRKTLNREKKDKALDNTLTVNHSDSSEPKQKKTKIPPFFIEINKSWDALLSRLVQIAPLMISNMQKNCIKIQVQTEIEYRNIQSLFIAERVKFRSFLLDSEKNFKYVIRGLPANTNMQLILDSIDTENINGLTISQLYRGNTRNRVPLPLFLIQMPKQGNNPDFLFQNQQILGLNVQFEKYRGRKGPIQCHNCQGYFHSSAVCHLETRCVKCAKSHKSSECTKAYEDPCTCALCGGPHPANYRQCPKFPGELNKKPNKNHKTKINTNNAIPFTAKKVSEAVSFAKAAANAVAEGPSTSTEVPKIISAPQIGAISDADFLQNLFKLEKIYSKQVVLSTYQKCLPQLRAAPTDVDRIFILYQNLPVLNV